MRLPLEKADLVQTVIGNDVYRHAHYELTQKAGKNEQHTLYVFACFAVGGQAASSLYHCRDPPFSGISAFL